MTIVEAYQAYKAMLESKTPSVKTITIDAGTIKPYKVKKFNKDEFKPSKTEVKQYKVKEEDFQPPFKTKKSVEDVTERGKGGTVTDRVRINKNTNDYHKYGKFVTAFGTSKNSVEHCIFSSDENDVLAALDADVSASKLVQSSLIDTGYYTLGITEAPKIDVGMIDAFTWHCMMGNTENVKTIYKRGYKPHSSYPGLNPITASILSKNIEMLKLVLCIPAIKKIINKKDGMGLTPLQSCAKMVGIDPYEFALVLIKNGATEIGNKDVLNGKPSAIMLSLLNRASWSVVLFGALLSVSDPLYRDASGRTVMDVARELNNTEAIKMIQNFIDNGERSTSVLKDGSEIDPLVQQCHYGSDYKND